MYVYEFHLLKIYSSISYINAWGVLKICHSIYYCLRIYLWFTWAWMLTHEACCISLIHNRARSNPRSFYIYVMTELSRPDSSSLDEKTEPVTLCPRIAVTETYAQKLSICKCLRAPVCLLYPWCVHWDHEAWWRAKDLVVLVISYCLIAQATEELIASQH
jgi:hypothetical protein